jgi:hypothetical protein
MCWVGGTTYTNDVSVTIIKANGETRPKGQERVPARRLKMQIILKSSHQSNYASSISNVSSLTLEEGFDLWHA